MQTRAELVARMIEIALIDMKVTGGERAFLDEWVPDRWFREHQGNPLHRCENDHVSRCCLSSEEEGLLCLDCLCPVVWTFPEDEDGCLEVSWKKLQEKRAECKLEQNG